MKLVWATVTSVDSTRVDSLRCEVALDTGSLGTATCFPSLTGPVVDGDRVLLNTTAVELGLGTGGAHFVVAKIGEDGPTGVALDDPSGGHVMKLRYTPLQRDVVSVESPESPFHQTMARVTSIEGAPVVCTSLHSQVVLVAAAIRRAAPHLRICYVMTDQAALPLALSGVIADAVRMKLIDSTITCGQAFGGDYEAVNLHSALLAAHHVAAADVTIVGIGPGVVGTATPFGHGGVAQGEAINAVAALGGLPIACLRVSFADERERHRGLSHHTATALGTIARAKALVAVPFLGEAEWGPALAADLEAMASEVEHEGMELDYAAYDERALRGVKVTTMGRGYDDDPAFFEAAFAAGVVGALVATQDEDQGECGGGCAS